MSGFGSSTSSPFRMEVVTSSGRAAMVEFLVQSDVVAVLHHDRCGGVFDRTALRAWLGAPGPPLAMDEVTFSVDRMVDQDGRVALTLPDVVKWTLSPTALAELRKRL
jgi:hypothetical protein